MFPSILHLKRKCAEFLHRTYASTVLPDGKVGSDYAVQDLRKLLDGILLSLTELESMYPSLLSDLLAAVPRCSGVESVLRHLSVSLESLGGHLMNHGNTTSVHFAYLSLIAELTQSGLEAFGKEGKRFVRPSGLPDMVRCHQNFPTISQPFLLFWRIVCVRGSCIVGCSCHVDTCPGESADSFLGLDCWMTC